MYTITGIHEPVCTIFRNTTQPYIPYACGMDSAGLRNAFRTHTEYEVDTRRALTSVSYSSLFSAPIVIHRSSALCALTCAYLTRTHRPGPLTVDTLMNATQTFPIRNSGGGVGGVGGFD